MRLVIVESPYAGDIEANVTYARACIRDALTRGEAPFACHLLYTQPGVLRDEMAAERRQGMDAGWAWYRAAEVCAVYTDRGISPGMAAGIAVARAAGKPVEYRSLKVGEESGSAPAARERFSEITPKPPPPATS